jgi:hypothetical protein
MTAKVHLYIATITVDVIASIIIQNMDVVVIITFVVRISIEDSIITRVASKCIYLLT